MRWLRTLGVLALIGCTAPHGVVGDHDGGLGADGASGSQRCPDLFTCMATACTAPAPPPEPQAEPKPPPRLPAAAGIGCLSDCAATIYGPDRGAALALADCAKERCATPSCEAGIATNQCLEACLWHECAAEIGACGRGPTAGSGDCLSGLRCIEDLPPQRGLDALLSCLEGRGAASGALLQTALSCVASKGPNAAPCGAALEQCACDGVDMASTPGAPIACATVLTSCHLSGPCGRAACRARLAAASLPLADAVITCMVDACGQCEDGNCRLACAQNKCVTALPPCILDRCPADRGGDGDSTCTAGMACIAGCSASSGECCLSGCAAGMTAQGRSEAMALLGCAAGQCACLTADDVHGCIAACKACGAERLACQGP